MAFEAPSPVRGRSVQSVTSATTPVTLNYPATVAAGDELILVISVDSTNQNIAASGWTELDQQDISAETGAVFRRTATGSEGGGTFTATFDITSRTVAAAVYAIDADGTAEVAVATGSSTTPDPPSLSPSGGAREYLWLIAANLGGTAVPRGWPDNFGGWASIRPTGGPTTVMTAEYLLTAATLNPGAITIHATQAWAAWTIAVPTAVSAGNFPIVEGLAESQWDTGATTQALSLPTGISAGDLLLAEVATRTVQTPSITDWTVLVGPTSTGGLETGTVLYKEAVGDESGTVTVSFTGSVQGTGSCRRISGADIAKLEGEIAAGASAATVSPPAITPASGSDQVLWLTGYTGDTNLSGPVGAAGTSPLPWSFNFATAPVSIVVDSGLYSGAYALEDDSITPATFDIEAARRHVSWTLAVYPTAAPPPDAPTNPAAAALSASSIRVTWDDVADETGFRVERSDDGTTGWTDVSGNLAADTTSWDDTGLTASTQYFYRVIAFNAAGDSSPSSTVNATTASSGGGGGNRMGTDRAIRRSPRYGQ